MSRPSMAVLLPREPVDPQVLAQGAAGLRTRFGDLAGVDMFSPPELLERHRAAIPEGRHAPTPIGDGGAVDMTARDIVAYCALSASTPLPLVLRRQTLLYRVERDGAVLLENRPLDAEEWPGLDAHVFNRLSPLGSAADRGLLYFFPYGFLVRWIGMGPINEFGHRIGCDFQSLADRPANHKLIACFGGSATFSQICLHDQMWSARLESRLNERARQQGDDATYTVLNFGQCASVMLNQTLQYLLFVQGLKPDVVIAHDGANDLGYGMLGDPRLVGKYHVAYTIDLEGWAQNLHQSQDRPTSQPALPYQPITPPVQALKAYVARKTQFRRLVEADGGVFVWGFQPMCWAKSLSPAEQAGLDRWRESPWRTAIDAMPPVYELYERNFRPDPQLVHVNVHDAFRRFGADRTLFGDHVHLLPDGDAEVAEIYLSALAERVLPRLSAPETSRT